jgi:hypothetical protein
VTATNIMHVAPDIPTGSHNSLSQVVENASSRGLAALFFRGNIEEPKWKSWHIGSQNPWFRHGFEPSFDHRRLQWSNWFRCQDSFSLVLAPCKPGIFALGEEVIAPGELAVGEGKRMLALFQISEAEDCR